MPKQKYSPEFKSKIILAILQGDKEFNVICSEHNLNPNMVHTWKREFLQNAPLAFSAHHERKEAKRKVFASGEIRQIASVEKRQFGSAEIRQFESIEKSQS